MSSESKTSLEQIVVGDEVAYKQNSSYRTAMKRCVVTKITPTQILLGNQRFRKDDGREVTSNTRHDSIYALGDRRGDGMTYAEVAREEEIEISDLELRYKLARFITEYRARDLVTRFDASVLKQAAELLGYKN